MSERAYEKVTEVCRAATLWWLHHRPVGWSEAEHVENPTVNTATTSEATLARAVAAAIGASDE